MAGCSSSCCCLSVSMFRYLRVPHFVPAMCRSLAAHNKGLPVLRALPLCTCCRHYPGTATGRTASLISPCRISLPRNGRRVGLRNVLFEACSAFTRVTACTLALSPYFVTRFTGGFNRFVTSTVAPIASGWSSRRVGLSPTGKSAAFSRRTPIADVERVSRLRRIMLNPDDQISGFDRRFTTEGV